MFLHDLNVALGGVVVDGDQVFVDLAVNGGLDLGLLLNSWGSLDVLNGNLLIADRNMESMPPECS